MTSDEARELRKQWGDNPCDHPDLIEEFETESSADVIWRCVQCGRAVDLGEWRKSQEHH